MSDLVFYSLSSLLYDGVMMYFAPVICSMLYTTKVQSRFSRFKLAIVCAVIFLSVELLLKLAGLGEVPVDDMVAFIIITLVLKRFTGMGLKQSILSMGLYNITVVLSTQILGLLTAHIITEVPINEIMRIQNKAAYILGLIASIVYLVVLVIIIKNKKIIKKFPSNMSRLSMLRIFICITAAFLLLAYMIVYYGRVLESTNHMLFMLLNAVLVSFMTYNTISSNKNLTVYKNLMEELKDTNEKLQITQEKLVQLERLATLGQMIGGVAHNLRTPIMSISGAVDAVTDLADEYDNSIEDSDVTQEDHFEIVKDMEKWISQITPQISYMSDMLCAIKGQVTSFSADETTIFTVDELVKTVWVLMEYPLKSNNCSLNIKMNPDVAELKISGNMGSMVQIIDNLIINAIQSYSTNNRKTLGIDFVVNKDADRLVLKIRDYGRGIPKHIQEKLFNEMVTTKGKNGTGLGLFMSYSSIKGQFGGDMWFESEEGRGTIFYISVPLN